MNGMHMDELNQKVCGRLVRGEDAAARCSSMWAGTMGGKCCCGDLKWQSCRTICPSEDIKGVLRILAQLKSFFDAMMRQFQVIVTEHKGEISWAAVKDSVLVVCSWCGKKQDYLIPAEWLDE